MSYTVNRVALEVEAPPAIGSYIVGINHVGDALTAAGVTTDWQPVTGQARTIDVARGGGRQGVISALDTGTLTVVFINAWSPVDNPTIAPNRPIRLRTTAGDPLFAGRIADVATTYDLDGNTFVTVTAVDGIKSASNTNVAGAHSPNGFETWADRIARLCVSAATDTNPPEN